MSYSGITVSGYDSAFKVDAVQMSDGDARQILAIGTGTSALEEGVANLAHVEGSSIFVKDTQLSSVTQIVDPRNKSKAQAVSGVVGVSGTASESRSKAMAVSGVVGVSGITTGVVGVSGSPSATISNVTHSVSSTSVSLSATGDAPLVQTLIPAPGAGKSIMVHAISIAGWGTGATSYGFTKVYFGTASDATTVHRGVIVGSNGVTVNNTCLPFPLKCGTNAAVSVEVTEQDTHILLTVTIYHSEITL
jgi:hypothetical protein